MMTFLPNSISRLEEGTTSLFALSLRVFKSFLFSIFYVHMHFACVYNLCVCFPQRAKMGSESLGLGFQALGSTLE